MGELQFIASIVGSLAWPVTIVAAVFLLRRELRRMLPRLTKLKYGEIELEFRKKLDEAEEVVAELPEPTSLPQAEQAEKQLQSEQFSNNSGVFVAWLVVESAILNLARSAKLLETNMTARRAAEVLLGRELIDEHTYQAIRDLSELRNIAVHPQGGRMISSEELDRFTRIAEKVAAILEDRRRSL
jgi:uncharacterized protein YutE (UPF0331/DUF86 family)